MAKVVLSARVESELAGWVKVYAKRRDSTVGAVLEAALAEFREAAQGGVPDLPVASKPARKRKVAQPAPQEHARAEVDRAIWARQERLNRGKYGA